MAAGAGTGNLWMNGVMMNRKQKIRDYLKSLKFRLLLVLLLFGIVPMLVMQFFVIRGYENVRLMSAP
ncbi:hypothetical protein C823_002543 [Eubacterium plexicaudatum ASF492]|nr:hypothetical protein C823_002543 [Eubacterium plexicaudatum ASF492]